MTGPTPYTPPSQVAGVAVSVHTQTVAMGTVARPVQQLVSDAMYYEQDFTNSAQWTVVHNLGLHPNVSLLNAAGEEVFTDVKQPDVNTVVVTWPSPMTGKVICS